MLKQKRQSNLCLDLFTENLAGLQAYEESQRRCLRSGNSEYQKMLAVLTRAMQSELTDRQQECVYLYYFEQQKQREIASALEIGIPTVSKHLKKARRRLAVVMGYAFERFSNQEEDC